MKLLHWGISGFIVFNLLACGQTAPVKVPTDLTSNTRTTHVVSKVPQKQLIAKAPLTDSTGFGSQYGLIGTLVTASIDSYVNSEAFQQAQKEIGPLTEQLKGFDFSTELREATVNYFKSKPWATLHADKAPKIDGDYYVDVSTVYQLSVDYSRLEVTSIVKVSKGKKRRITINSAGDKKTIVEMKDVFQRSYTYASPSLDQDVKTPEEVEAMLAEVDVWYKKRMERVTSDQEKPRVRKEKKRRIKAAKGPLTYQEQKQRMIAKWQKDDAKLIRSYMQESIPKVLGWIDEDLDAPNAKVASVKAL